MEWIGQDFHPATQGTSVGGDSQLPTPLEFGNLKALIAVFSSVAMVEHERRGKFPMEFSAVRLLRVSLESPSYIRPARGKHEQ